MKPATELVNTEVDLKNFRDKNGTRLRAVVIRAKKQADEDGQSEGESNAVADPWAQISRGEAKVIEPPFDPLGLALLAEKSSELGQCVEAMEINVAGFGWRLRRRDKDPEVIDQIQDKLDKEKETFEEFLTYANFDPMSSFVELRKKTRRDLELTGNAYWEIIRDAQGRIDAFNHIPSFTMRLGLQENNFVEVVEKRVVGTGFNRKVKQKRIKRRFRTFVQARFIGDRQVKPVYFKEYGDPRMRNARTGEVVKSKAQLGKDDREATEVIHFKIYSTRTPYGVPRFAGTLLAIFGARAAEEVTFITLKNNNIPSMMLLVSEGQLTEGTIERLTNFVESSIQGSDNYSKFVVIEAAGFGDEDSDEAPTPVKLEAKPLTGDQHTDAMFVKYDESNQDKIRRSFRLPPIFVGRTDDYTRATADTSKKIGDEQVFNPERMDEDWRINRILMDMGMVYHEFVTNTPNVTVDEDLINVMTGAEKTGGMTPRISRQMVQDILGQELGDITGIDPDIPFSLQMAEAVKNMASPNEPGQQVTALKLYQAMEDDEPFGLDLVTKVVSEGSPLKLDDVIVNLGEQGKAAAGGQSAVLTAQLLNLEGRKMLVGDGKSAYGRVQFGIRERLSIEAAAKLISKSEDTVQAMFPNRVEVWAHHVESREPFSVPQKYVHPDNRLFARFNADRNVGGKKGKK